MKVAMLADDRPSFMRAPAEGLNVPASFAKGPYPAIETLRKSWSNVPIVNYDVHFLPTLDSWALFLLRGDKGALRKRSDENYPDVLALHRSHFGVGR
jgi:hypothetical protein